MKITKENNLGITTGSDMRKMGFGSNGLELVHYFYSWNYELNNRLHKYQASLHVIRPKYSDPTRLELKDVDFIKMYAVIGLLYYGAVLSQIQRTYVVGMQLTELAEIFRFVMAQKQLEMMLHCLKFDDKTTQLERKEPDPAAAISQCLMK